MLSLPGRRLGCSLTLSPRPSVPADLVTNDSCPQTASRWLGAQGRSSTRLGSPTGPRGYPPGLPIPEARAGCWVAWEPPHPQPALTSVLCPLSTARIIRTKQWCDMLPCLEGEGCDLLINRSGWTCTQPGGRIKTTPVCTQPPGCPGVWGPEQAGPGVDPTPAMARSRSLAS